MRTSNTTLQILSVRGFPPPPPPPLRTKFSLKKSYGFRGYPPSPLYGHLPNFFSLKEGSKNCVLAENTPIFRSKKVTDLGCTPLPTFTDQNFWRKKELQICEVLPPNLGNLILLFLHVTTTFCSYDIDMIWYDMITMITMMIAMIVMMMLMIILVFNDDKSEVF